MHLLPIGTAAGLQMAHLMILVLLPFTLANIAHTPRAWALYGILATPQLVSLLANGLQPTDINASLASLFALLAIPVTAVVFRTSARVMFAGIALVFLFHGSVGLLQVWKFSNEQFPIHWIYINPAFQEFTMEWLHIYARYVQRPFGVFPEPSSLLASVSPWVVLAIGSIGFKQSPVLIADQAMMRRFVWFAYGTLLITMILSASGALLFFALGAGCILVSVIGQMSRQKPGKAFGLIVASVVALLALAGSLIVRAQGELVQSRGSWNERFSSLEGAFDILKIAEPSSLWLGHGAGQVAGLIERSTSLDAVQSWVLSNVVANGLLGLLALIVVAGIIIHAIAQTDRPWLWSVTTATWLTGPAVVTAYQDLIGIWGFIALPLTV